METAGGPGGAPSRPTRPLLRRCGPLPLEAVVGEVKAKLRDDCRQRAREQRERLLASRRAAGGQPEAEAAAQGQGLVEPDEIARDVDAVLVAADVRRLLRQEAVRLLSCRDRRFDFSALVLEEGEPQGEGEGMQVDDTGAEPGPGPGVDGAGALGGDAEVELDPELVLRCTAWSEGELAEAEAEIRTDIFAAMEAELREMVAEVPLAGTPAAGAGPGSRGLCVRCPVCRGADLAEAFGVVTCPAERWQLDCRQEGLGLADLGQRLHSVAQSHQASCPGELRFALDQGMEAMDLGPGPSLLAPGVLPHQGEVGFGATLWATCEACGLWEVVM
ncbi:hypothetical protein HYH03_018957 [Edaphochlamys debaryana]|uniref:RPA-interacting protein C-terminal domain-containing protein n=1 Tax=Edaphochlamys debaryana TaxID=47281 RepID=A0A835XEA5_9CHLO|nr:hypothetical protein HYH03_018957 [Edaphochlamys debaryana]|eukprot:KAG2482101.1 hypothetical protein HYH03_018957 [Edaphochlamys debaryana]